MKLTKRYDTLLQEIVSQMKATNKEVTKTSLTGAITSQVASGTILGAKLNKVTHKIIQLFCDKHNIK